MTYAIKHTIQPKNAVPNPAKPHRQTRHIKQSQADEILEAAKFARLIDLPLEAHATIHWGLTDAGDDPDGLLLAKVREGLSKALHRRSIPFAAAWVRERLFGGQAEVEHSHMVFHLPRNWQKGKKRADVTSVIERLIERHAGRVDEHTLKLTFHTNGDLRYLLKGVPPQVQRELKIKTKWRKPQGLISGKRRGTTQNIG